MARLSSCHVLISLLAVATLIVATPLSPTAADQSADQNVPDQPSFRNHVQPILAKFGCSTGACHGAAAGKGGFKLSLRGYDPVGDHHAITRQDRGRRVELADPGRSLILAKPSGAIAHKGGLRFDVDSYEYRIIARWISQGAAPPREEDRRVTKLEILPPHIVLKPRDIQNYTVQAHYSDGSADNVTRWAKFTSTNEVVAKVDEQGKASIVGNGEGAIMAWYQSKIVLAQITSPYLNEVPAVVFVDAPRRNFIDELTLAKLQELNLPPSPRSGDAEFLRRAFLDTIGTLPSSEETRDFLEDDSPDKRDRLIDSLLARQEFVDYWTFKWSDLLLVNGRKLRPPAVKAYHEWIRRNVAANMPWDEFARQLVTARGGSLENGATNFFALHQDPENMTENVSQAFLSLSIACAKCHNHPLEKWTNDQYYAMANVFSRVRAKGWGGDPRNGDGNRTLYVAERGELIQPIRGKPQPPTPLDADPLPFDSTEDRRKYLADWLTSPENPYFSRAIANRVWANFLGVGVVHQVDDLRTSNPASNENLLAALADYLVQHNYDLKELMRAILRSETYQRTSRPLAENAAETRFYSRYYPRRMMAEVMLDAVSQVTAVPSEFTQIAHPGADFEKIDAYAKGTRAIQLYDSAVVSYFLSAFGRNEREITCECERSNEPSIVQVLHIVNGDTLNGKLKTKDNVLDRLLAANMNDDQLIETAYLSTLSRYPTPEETEKLAAILSDSEEAERRVVLEDLYWSLMSSREFLFHH